MAADTFPLGFFFFICPGSPSIAFPPSLFKKFLLNAFFFLRSGRRGRSRDNRSRSRSSSWSRDHGRDRRNRGSKRRRRDDTSPRSSPSVGKKVSASSNSIKQANKAAAPKAEKKVSIGFRGELWRHFGGRGGAVYFPTFVAKFSGAAEWLQ